MTKINVLFIITVFSFLVTSLVSAQSLSYKPGEIILCVHPDADLSIITQRHARLENHETDFKLTKCLSEHMHIWKATFDEGKIDVARMIADLSGDREIFVVQKNHFIKPRKRIPNDPMLQEQWQWINTGKEALLTQI
ncbi:MAG: hypothetical protein IPL46_21350 [Saprospiraceae bacterium]|nr:hypothetical protein [Saprospiraceae bacterium]